MSLSRSQPGSVRPAQAERPDFRLGPHRVRPSVNRVMTPEGEVQLEPKIMQVLVCLADSAGRTVSKQRLFEEVWAGVHVTEDALTRAVGELRRALGDDPARPSYIETIRKTGYRLMTLPSPAVEEQSGPRTDAPASAPAATDRRRKRMLSAGIALLLALAAVLGVFLARRSAARASQAHAMRVRTLTALPGSTRDPAVSPDGTRVAFAWNGGSGEDFSIYVQLVDAESPLRLTKIPAVEDRLPAWSPDGQWLAFTRQSRRDCRLAVVSALGGAERTLAPCGDGQYRHVSWSPDGKWLVRAARTASSVRLELLSPDTLETRALTNPPPGTVGDSSAAFSPDGNAIAFARNVTDGVSDVYRVDADGSGLRRLTFDSREIMGVDWTDEGRSVLFSSSRAGIYSLWKVGANGGNPVWVAGGGAKMKHPSTARTRRVIAFENWIYAVNLWRVPLSGNAAPQRLTEAGDEWNFAPRISPDGKRLAFVSTRSGAAEIWTAGAGGEDARRLTSFEGARLESPRWSPDGRSIAFTARREGPAALYVVSADGAAPRRVAGAEFDPVAPDWSRDRRSLYFGSRRGGSWQIWRLEISTGRAVPATRDGGYAAQESPDGRWLYYTRPDARGLWREPLPRSEGAPENVAADLAPEDWENWEVTQRGIYFRELCARHPEPGLALLPFGASTPVDLGPLTDQGWAGFAVSPDGASVIYPRVDRHACDIRLLENAP
jgi:Tol biopolymer transport system component/DNA-binding winged helix-turn-helix (wHTH) protein